MTQTKTKVLFLILADLQNEENEKDVFALFVDEQFNKDINTRTCYAHVGQHSCCTLNYANECKHAIQQQYAPLAAELEAMGYELEILNEN